MSESLLKQFISLHDGNINDFSEVESLFEALYGACGKTIYSRTYMKKIHTHLLATGTDIQLTQFRKVCIGTVEMEIRLQNEEEDKVIHFVCSFEGDKLVRAQITNCFATRHYMEDLDMFNLTERFKTAVGVCVHTIKHDTSA